MSANRDNKQLNTAEFSRAPIANPVLRVFLKKKRKSLRKLIMRGLLSVEKKRVPAELLNRSSSDNAETPINFAYFLTG